MTHPADPYTHGPAVCLDGCGAVRLVAIRSEGPKDVTVICRDCDTPLPVRLRAALDARYPTTTKASA